MRDCKTQTFGKKAKSSAVAVALEAKPELEDIVLKLVSEPMFPRVLPLTIDDLERYVLHKQYNVYVYKSMHGQVHVASI